MKKGTPHHPKMRCLATALKLPVPYAVGLMEMLWHYVAQVAPRGDIGVVSDLEIAGAVAWEKKPATLINVLVSCGWLDRDEKHRLIVHDWPHHCDKYIWKVLRRKETDFLSLYEVSVYKDDDLSRQKTDIVRQKATPSRVAEAEAEASSAPLDISNSENLSPRARSDESLDMEDSVETFMQNSARRNGLRGRVKLGKRDWERQAEKARVAERDYGPDEFRGAWVQFLDHLRTATEIEHPVGYFLATVERWLPCAAAPSPRAAQAHGYTAPTPPPTEAPNVAVAPLDETLRAYCQIAKMGGKAIGEHEVDEARPLWASLDDEQRKLAAQDYARKVSESTAAKYIPTPANHLKQRPWTRTVQERVIPLQRSAQDRRDADFDEAMKARYGNWYKPKGAQAC